MRLTMGPHCSKRRRISLAISHQAVVLDQGRVIHSGKASDLQAQPELLDGLLGIAVTKD